MSRASVVGTTLDVLLLAAEGHDCVGVDTASGAFVRGRFPAPLPDDLAAYDVIRSEVADHSEVADASRPELVALASAPTVVDHIAPKQAERWLRALRHPRRVPLLGFLGPAVPYWTLNGDRPSVALVDLGSDLRVVRRGEGFVCRLLWRGAAVDLPLADRRLSHALVRRGEHLFTPEGLSAVLGQRPARALVVLTPPLQGYCYKVVAGLLPRA